ncbi:hypothetical protein R1sor_007503 [Riccia sorocarpa]|uniref:Endonuclease/exonuclease/phosphatase domain-containing protein n=1 Tax=Riccia sorocarpa TaxID=122646 RepID=A0ABD3HU41_9MARC
MADTVIAPTDGTSTRSLENVLRQSRGENVGMSLRTWSKVSKQLDDVSKLLTLVYGEVGSVKTALADLQIDVHKLHVRLDEVDITKSQIELVKSDCSGLQLELGKCTAKIDELATVSITNFEQIKTSVERPHAEIGTPVIPDFNQAMVALETSLCSYVEKSKETQVAALEDHGKEIQARATREFNLRTVGLSEDATEDTREMIDRFLKNTLKVTSPRVERAVRVGRNDAGPRTVLRTSARGQGFGGIRVWARESKVTKVEVQYTDVLKQFVVLRVTSKNQHAFLIITYFAPPGAPIYANSVDESPYVALTSEVAKCQQTGPVILVGDFNCRISSAQREDLGDHGAGWRTENTMDPWKRTSEDKECNQFANGFLSLASVCGLTILNGTSKFPLTQERTFQSERGFSVIDYLLVDRQARDTITSFRLLPFQPESDHRPLLFSISGYTRSQKTYMIQPQPRQFLDYKLRDRFSELLETRIQGVTDSGSVVSTIVTTADEVFRTGPLGDQPWSSETCKEARRKALNSADSERSNAFRSYKKLIRSLKRKYIREQQVILTEELTHTPQLFWIRFQVPRSIPELSRPELVGYLQHLYFIPQAEKMPQAIGAVCVFSKDEVERTLASMKAGTARDLH